MAQSPVLRNIRADTVLVPFSWQSPSVVVLGSYVPGQVIVAARIAIRTAFDGAPTLALGTLASPSALLGPESCTPTVAGDYENPTSFVFPPPGDSLRLVIVLGGATMGAGFVSYELRNA